MTNQEQIDEIMDCFDFGKVEIAMKALNWSWIGSDNPTPLEYELRKHARKLLKKVMDYAKENDHGMTHATGGFIASSKKYEDGSISLKLAFEVATWDNNSGDDYDG